MQLLAAEHLASLVVGEELQVHCPPQTCVL